jgi:hypothetical protein
MPVREGFRSLNILPSLRPINSHEKIPVIITITVNNNPAISPIPLKEFIYN